MASKEQRNQVILAYLSRYRYMSVKQLHCVIDDGCSERSVRRSLEQLKELGLTRSSNGGCSGQPDRTQMHFLSKPGIEYAKAEFPKSVAPTYDNVCKVGHSTKAAHRMNLVDVMCYLEKAVRQTKNLTLTGLWLDYFRPNGNAETSEKYQLNGEEIVIVPDAIFTLRHSVYKVNLLFALEYDNHTETIATALNCKKPSTSIIEKMKNYDNWMKYGQPTANYKAFEPFSNNYPTVLWVFKTKMRAFNALNKFIQYRESQSEGQQYDDFHLLGFKDLVKNDFLKKKWFRRNDKSKPYFII